MSSQVYKYRKRQKDSMKVLISSNRTGVALNCMFPVSTEYCTKTVLKDGPPQVYTNYRNLYTGNYN